MRDLEIKKPFFHLGPNNNWRQLLDDKNRIKIENVLEYEMKEI